MLSPTWLIVAVRILVCPITPLSRSTNNGETISIRDSQVIQALQVQEVSCLYFALPVRLIRWLRDASSHASDQLGALQKRAARFFGLK